MPFQMPAEWAPHEAVWTAWPHDPDQWLEGLAAPQRALMAMCAAFGDTPGVNLELMIGQLVNLVRDGQAVRMSKRAGTVVTLEDLVEAVGVDAAR